MLFKNITILDENLDIQENMYVGVKDRKIVYIGKDMPQEMFAEHYDGKGKLLMSGFFNAHGHSPMGLMRGYGENMALQDWLNKRIFPFEDKLTGEAVYWGTMLGIAESIKYGIVSTSDMYYFCEDMARAVAETGVKANIGRALVNFADVDIYELESFKESKSLYEQYHNKEMGRIKIDMSLHAEYTSNPKTVKQLAEYTKDIGALVHVHVSETKSEHEDCMARHDGLTPMQYLKSLGLLDSKAVAAHCVWVTEEDMNIMAEKSVTVGSCPVSNMKLASGICNIQAMLDKGINVAIGTDSTASNNSLNFLEEMKFFAVGAKVRSGDPTHVTPFETIKAATLGGAIGQGRKDCGQLALGKKADLIVLDLNQVNMQPIHNLLNNIVYSASSDEIVLTMVDGKVLYKDGNYLTLDIEKTIFNANNYKNKILGEL